MARVLSFFLSFFHYSSSFVVNFVKSHISVTVRHRAIRIKNVNWPTPNYVLLDEINLSRCCYSPPAVVYFSDNIDFFCFENIAVVNQIILSLRRAVVFTGRTPCLSAAGRPTVDFGRKTHRETLRNIFSYEPSRRQTTAWTNNARAKLIYMIVLMFEIRRCLIFLLILTVGDSWEKPLCWQQIGSDNCGSYDNLSYLSCLLTDFEMVDRSVTI